MLFTCSSIIKDLSMYRYRWSLVWSWCMRFEGKHNYFEDLVNRVNDVVISVVEPNSFPLFSTYWLMMDSIPWSIPSFSCTQRRELVKCGDGGGWWLATLTKNVLQSCHGSTNNNIFRQIPHESSHKSITPFLLYKQYSHLWKLWLCYFPSSLGSLGSCSSLSSTTIFHCVGLVDNLFISVEMWKSHSIFYVIPQTKQPPPQTENVAYMCNERH